MQDKQSDALHKSGAEVPARSAAPLWAADLKPDVIVLPSAPARAPPAAPPSVPRTSERAQVTVAPNLLDLISGPAVTPEAKQAAERRRGLNEVVHGMLIIGLAVSVGFMLAGLALDVLQGHEVPAAVPDLRELYERVVALRPSGFLATGLLVLIATPILRVVGSVFAFLYDRDWRYACITGLVLVVVSLGLLIGKP